MNISRIAPISILSALIVSASPSFADKLPKAAKALSDDEVTKLYSGHTAVWAPTAMAYFAADGAVKQVVGGVSKPGSWTVKGNEFCMAIKGVVAETKKLDGSIYTDCWQWYKAGKVYFTLYSKHWDNSKVDKKNFSTKDIDTLKPGDLIGAVPVPG